MRVMVAMSGGVDSSVAALLSKQAGHECLGVTMKLYAAPTDGGEPGRGCCSLDDVEDARRVATALGIPYYVFNFTADFDTQVVARFIDAYERGLTPNPCIDCNRYLKFERLHERAKVLGCDRLVTGHYARVVREGERYLLKKALDPTKDQSYVLYTMTREQLAHTAFPLGELTKRQVRALAQEAGLATAAKRDSQDICFVPGGDYAAFIAEHTGKSYPPGQFVDTAGRVLGEHRGLIRYTIGQRRGLGLSLPRPLYVCRKNVADNTVVLCTDEELYRRECLVRQLNWIAFDAPPARLRAKVKTRYSQTEAWAEITPCPDPATEGVRVVFEEPVRAPTPGQAAVFYEGDTVLGGGVIW
ncbi:MAG: tRNA 2-thiouridine(34) synthase MnmA [Eubacteriales bacterium]